jgi:hypothetical protein
VTAWLRSRDAHGVAVVVLLASLLLLPALLWPSRLVYPSWSDFCDLTLIHWPKVQLIRESLAQGNGWPLWSTYGLSGQPLAANQLAMLFYPPILLLLLEPTAWAFSLFYVLHLAWAGIGTYWLVRGLGRRPEAALLAATIFALSGKLVAHTAIGHASLLAAIAWLPWALASLHRALARSDRRWLSPKLALALLGGIALAAQATTHSYALIYTAYGLLAYAGLYLALAPGSVVSRMRSALRQMPTLILIPVTGILLGAIQLLPLLEMIPYSNRALSLTEATFLSLSPAQTLASIFFPVPALGHEWTIYPGLLTLGLAASAWFARRERPVMIFAILVAAGVILALGDYTPLYRLFYRLLPGLGWLRTPGRLWFFVTLGLAVLAAYGLEEWQNLWRHPLRGRIRLAVVAATIFALVLSIGTMVALGQSGRGMWGLGVFGLLSGALLLWALRRRPGPIFATFAILLIAADLLSVGLTLLRFVPQAEIAAQGRTAAEWLAAQPGTFRVYSPSYSLPQPAAIQADLEQIDGVEPVHLADYDRFMALAGGYGEGPFSVTTPPFPEGVPLEQAHRNTQPNLRLSGLLNGQYLAAAFALDLPGLALRWQGENTWLYENEHALPRGFVVHQTEPVTHQEVWDRLNTLDPTRVALVENDRRLDGPGEPSPAQIVKHSPNRVVVETDLEAPGLLVLSEIWYPGWQAYDNGDPTPILRTDAILRGVYLDAGSHTIEFDYNPRTVCVGLAISSPSALALLIALAWTINRGVRS